MTTFSRPQQRKRSTPDAAEAFVEGASTSAVTPPAPAPLHALPPRPVPLSLLAPEPEREPEVYGQTVRFTAREKAALQLLARANKRSEQFVIKEILGPGLLEAERKLRAQIEHAAE